MRARRLPPAIEFLEKRLCLDARFAAPVITATPADPQGIAAADFNEDGKLDVAVTSFGGGTVSVLLGNGDGTFTLSSTFDASANASGVTAVDLNEDGNVDLVAVGSDVAYYRGNGDGTFQD